LFLFIATDCVRAMPLFCGQCVKTMWTLWTMYLCG